MNNDDIERIPINELRQEEGSLAISPDIQLIVAEIEGRNGR